MTSAPYAFISYSRLDAPAVDRIVQALSAGGIPVWRDTAEIAPGEDWAESLEKALAGASAYIYVASRNAGRSSWIERELQFVVKRASGQPLAVPVILDDEGEARLPEFLRSRQWVDLRRDFNAGLQLLATTLARVLPREPDLEPPRSRSKGYAFISYVEEDADFVGDLKRFLQEKGYGYWDFEESERDYQVQFFLELEGIIKEATATLSVLSPKWKVSKWTTKEYLYSEDVGTPVFLLRAKETEPTLLIAGVPYIDFVRDKAKGYSRLVRELSRRGL